MAETFSHPGVVISKARVLSSLRSAGVESYFVNSVVARSWKSLLVPVCFLEALLGELMSPSGQHSS